MSDVSEAAASASTTPAASPATARSKPTGAAALLAMTAGVERLDGVVLDLTERVGKVERRSAADSVAIERLAGEIVELRDEIAELAGDVRLLLRSAVARQVEAVAAVSAQPTPAAAAPAPELLPTPAPAFTVPAVPPHPALVAPPPVSAPVPPGPGGGFSTHAVGPAVVGAPQMIGGGGGPGIVGTHPPAPPPGAGWTTQGVG